MHRAVLEGFMENKQIGEKQQIHTGSCYVLGGQTYCEGTSNPHNNRDVAHENRDILAHNTKSQDDNR
jgi:hypothetical protein